MRVLIVSTGRYNRGALATSRALAEAGWEVGCATWDDKDLLGASRSITWRHQVPPPTADVEGFVAAVATALHTGSYAAVLPSSDAETLALSRYRDRLPITLPYPPHEAVIRAFDKLELSSAAAACGIATPWTTPATKAALADIREPVVVKARLHWREGPSHMPSMWPTWVCADQDEASDRVAEIHAAGGEPLLQEVVRGRCSTAISWPTVAVT